MDDLGQPSQGFTSSVQLRHPSTVNYESADEMNASRYQVLWSNIMDKGNYTKPSGYHKVAVLLLCWDQDCVDLATQEEVDKLKAVFEDKFGYDATIAKLSPANGRLQVQVNQKVANFVSDHDGQNNLLIVYYAGHGKPGKNFGDLELFGQTSPNDPRDSRERQSDRIVWNKTEDLLKCASADILEIFDCCYAGNLGLTRGDDRLFEFLAAAKAQNTTAIPGEESFTSALIYALVRLVDKNKGGRFTTDELLRTIREHAPQFPKEQEPHLVERGDPHTKAGRIMLHPIRRDGVVCQSPSNISGTDQTRKHTVTLHFDFGEKPSDRILETLGQGLNNSFKRSNLEVLRVRWGEMKASATALALKKFSGSLRRRRASKKEERPTMDTRLGADLRRLASTPSQNLLSPLSPPQTAYHTQDSAGNTDFAASGSAESGGEMGSRPKSGRKRRRNTQNGGNAS